VIEIHKNAFWGCINHANDCCLGLRSPAALLFCSLNSPGYKCFLLALKRMCAWVYQAFELHYAISAVRHTAGSVSR